MLPRQLRIAFGHLDVRSSGGAASAVKMIGIIESRNGAFLLTDETTKVTIQGEGPDVSKYVGKRVEVAGSVIPEANAAAGATQVVRAVSIKTVTNRKAVAAAGGAAAGGAAAGGAAAGAGAGAAAGMSAATIGAIIGGVAVAGTVGGLARIPAAQSNQIVTASESVQPAIGG